MSKKESLRDNAMRFVRQYQRPGKEELERLYWTEEKSTTDIGKIFGGASEGTVLNWMREYKIPRKRKSLPEGFVIPTKEELEKWYIEERKSAQEIAIELGLKGGKTVTGWLDNYGIKRRTKAEAIRLIRGVERPSKETLERMYLQEHRTASEIRKELGLDSDSLIFTALKEYGIPMRTASQSRHLKKGFIEPTKEELEKYYIKEIKSIDLIAKELGTTYYHTRSLLIKNGIELKDSGGRAWERTLARISKKELEKLYAVDDIGNEETKKRLKLTSLTLKKLLRHYNIPMKFGDKKRNGYWISMSNNEITQYAKDNGLFGLAPSKAGERNPSFQQEVYKRGLSSEIFSIGRRNWESLSNEEIIQYSKDHKLFGLKSGQLSDKDGSFWQIVKKRGLESMIFGEKVGKRDWMSMSDQQIIDYAKQNRLFGIRPTEAKEADKTFYNEVLKRGLGDNIFKKDNRDTLGVLESILEGDKQ